MSAASAAGSAGMRAPADFFIWLVLWSAAVVVPAAMSGMSSMSAGVSAGSSVLVGVPVPASEPSGGSSDTTSKGAVIAASRSIYVGSCVGWTSCVFVDVALGGLDGPVG